MTPPLKGITLLHPWAWAIQKLGKDVENRSQPIGRMGGCVGMYLAIHGGVAPRQGNNEKWREFRAQVEGLKAVLESGAVSRRTVLGSGALVEVKGSYALASDRLIVPGIVAVAASAAACRAIRRPGRWPSSGSSSWLTC